MGWGTDNVPVDATQLTALRSNRRGQGTQTCDEDATPHVGWVGMGWGTFLLMLRNSQLYAATGRGQGMRHVMKMLRHMWVGWGRGGALITFLLMLLNSAVGWLLEDSRKNVVSNWRTRGKLDRRVDQRLLNQIKAFMYRHNSGHNLWKELGKLAKKESTLNNLQGRVEK